MGTQTNHPVCTATREFVGNTERMGFDYSAIGAPTYTLRIYNGQQLVHESPNHSGACVEKDGDRFPYRKLDLIDSHFGWWEDGPMVWHPMFGWIEGTPIYHEVPDTMTCAEVSPIQVIDGPLAMGDTVVAIPENPTSTAGPISSAQIKASGQIASLEIDDESLTFVHSTVRAFGHASLTPDGPGLTVANLGSSGQDGVSFALNHVAGWAGHWQPLDPTGSLPVGAWVQSAVTGAAAGSGAAGSTGDSLLGSWKLTKADAGRYAVTADFTPMGCTTVTLMVYNGATLVTTLTGMSGQLAEANGCVDDDHWGNPTPTGPDGLPGRFGGALTFMGPTTFTFPGSVSAVGDRLVILPEGGPAVSSLAETRLSASGIPQIAMDDERVFVGFAGMLHGSLGQAGLSVKDGQLAVSNIGSSGQDGVEIELGKPSERKLNLYYRALGDSGTLTFSNVGMIGTQSDQPVGNSSIEFSATTKTLSFDYSAIGASTYTLRIYNDKQLVHESHGHSGPCVVEDRYPYPLLPLDDFHMGTWEDTGKEDNLGIPIYEWCPGYEYQTSQSASSQMVIGGPTVIGNLVLAIPENPTMTVGSVSRTKIQASGQINSLRFAAESLGSPHSTASSLGQATLEPAGRKLTANNLGSSGQDGVSLALDNVAAWETHWQPLDPMGELPAGAYVQSEISGSAGAVSNGPLGSWRMTKTGTGSYAVTADFTPLGASTVTLLVYQGATLVTTLAGQSGALATANGCVDDDHWGNPTPTGPYGIPGRFGGALTFMGPTTFAIAGTSSVVGDRLVILPEGGADVNSLSAARLLASGIAQITLDDERIQVPYAGQLHGSLGQAGLNIKNGLLTAYNLGSSGQDGVEIDLRPPGGRRLNLYYQVPSADGTLSFTGLGSTNSQAEQVIGVTRIEYVGDTGTVSFDYSSIGSSTYTLRIYNGKTLVHESSGHPSGGTCVVKDGFKYKRLYGEDVHLGWYEDGPEYWNGTFWIPTTIYHEGYTCDSTPGGGTQRVIGGPTVFGDLVVGIPENPTLTVSAASRFKIQASGQITNFQINAESLSSDSVLPMPYSFWANNTAIAAGITVADLGGPQADYDHDGSSNLMEYAFGTDPLVPDNGPAVTSGITTLGAGTPAAADYFTLSCQHPADRAATPVAQTSDDLQSWTPAVLVSSVSLPSGLVLDTWRAPDPVSAKPRVLMRFQILLNE